jgi:hypothetical protein
MVSHSGHSQVLALLQRAALGRKREPNDLPLSGSPPCTRPNKKPNFSVTHGRTLSETVSALLRITPCDQPICDSLRLVATECDGSDRSSRQTFGVRAVPPARYLSR